MSNILLKLKKLWIEREELTKEKGVYFLKYKNVLGKVQEIQRQINELLKENSRR